jgi:outer membrane protein OmpA-like peptidoglycan-associated protein
LVSRDAAPAADPVSSSPAPAPLPPIATPVPAITKSFSLDSPVLAKQQKKVLRTLIKQVGAGGSFEVVVGVALSPGVTKRQAKALALAKARAVKNYLVLKGATKKNVSLKTKVYKVGLRLDVLHDTLVLGSTI